MIANMQPAGDPVLASDAQQRQQTATQQPNSQTPPGWPGGPPLPIEEAKYPPGGTACLECQRRDERLKALDKRNTELIQQVQALQEELSLCEQKYSAVISVQRVPSTQLGDTAKRMEKIAAADRKTIYHQEARILELSALLRAKGIDATEPATSLVTDYDKFIEETS